jgi:hypothetical protein
MSQRIRCMYGITSIGGAVANTPERSRRPAGLHCIVQRLGRLCDIYEALGLNLYLVNAYYLLVQTAQK